MSKKVTRSFKASSCSKPAAAAGSNDDVKENPTLSQIYRTLRLCLRYSDDHANIFNRLTKVMEKTDFIPLIVNLGDEELRRLMPMLAQSLTRMRLEIGEIPHLYRLCRKGGVSEMPLIRQCDVGYSKLETSGSNFNGYLLMLGKLLPQLGVLSVGAAIKAPFPSNLRHLRSLELRQSTSQAVLEQICQNCPHLQKLSLQEETKSRTTLDVTPIIKCAQLSELQLPLMIHSPLAVCHLEHLKTLSLQQMQLWPGMDWLSIVAEIIKAKQFELAALSVDGSWLAAPLDLSLLELRCCWSLKELLLSNCKLADRSTQSVLPLSCQRFSLRRCSVNHLLPLLRDDAMLRLLELLDCPLAIGPGQFLLRLIRQRKCLPSLDPLQLHFSHSTPLRRELTSWGARRRQHYEEWVQVQELQENTMTWKQTIGTISMIFGRPVNYTPDLTKLSQRKEPTPADLIKQLDLCENWNEY